MLLTGWSQHGAAVLQPRSPHEAGGSDQHEHCLERKAAGVHQRWTPVLYQGRRDCTIIMLADGKQLTLEQIFCCQQKKIWQNSLDMAVYAALYNALLGLCSRVCHSLAYVKGIVRTLYICIEGEILVVCSESWCDTTYIRKVGAWFNVTSKLTDQTMPKWIGLSIVTY